MRWAVFLLPAAILAVGLYAWWPPGAPPNRCSDLGAALIGGAVVAFSVLYLEQQLSRVSERRTLQLQLGTDTAFPGIDLSGRDLSGFYLPGRNFSGANLERANLAGANLSGADFSHANLSHTDLRGTKMDETPLYPSETLYPSDTLTPGPIWPAATTQGIGLHGAKYDSSTQWPPSVDFRAAGAVEVVPWWKRKPW